jgi:hypothetical protein
VTLDNDKYYTPTMANNSLFDSFAIDYNPKQRTAVISIFQITISSTHGGSAEGYARIRKIMVRVHDLIREKHPKGKVTVTVEYFLVCPEGESNHRWQMPAGWGEYTKHSDYRGSAFCIRIPVKG